MTRKIKNVFVNGISLVSKNNTPAVAEAENRFALFKTKETSEIQKIKDNLLKTEIYKIKKNIFPTGTRT